MSLRPARERVLQTLAFELGGLALVVPLYTVIMGTGAGESLVLIAVLSVTLMLWSPLHNTVFDWCDLRWTGRLASDRPQRWRLVHALSHEFTSVVASLPVLVLLGGHGLWEALVIDLTLSLFYTAYAYVFHLVYDRLRPVQMSAAPLPEGHGHA